MRLVLCGAAGWLLVRYVDITAMLLCLPLLVRLAVPELVDTCVRVWRGWRGRALRSVQGQFYDYHGIRLQVLQDPEQRSWLKLADAQKVAGPLPPLRLLALSYPGSVQARGKPPAPHMRVAELVQHLSKQNDARALRFRTWLQHNVLYPEAVRRGERPPPLAPLQSASTKWVDPADPAGPADPLRPA